MRWRRSSSACRRWGRLWSCRNMLRLLRDTPECREGSCWRSTSSRLRGAIDEIKRARAVGGAGR